MSSLSEKIDQVNSITLGMGLKYLLKEAYKILGNPLLMFDMDGRRIDYYQETSIEDPIWNDIIDNGLFSEQALQLFKDEGFIDDIATVHNIASIKSDKITCDAFVGKIRRADINIVVACLVMIASDRWFGAYDPVLFEAFCEVLTKEIATMEYFHSYALTYQDTIIAKLIDGNIPDKAMFAGHAANLYEGFQENIYIGVVDTTDYDPEHSKLAYFRDLFRQMQPGFRYSIYFDYIVIIMSSARQMLNLKRVLLPLNKFFKEKRIYAGISDGFENIYELAKYYHQAIRALKNGKEYAGDQWIFFHSKVK